MEYFVCMIDHGRRGREAVVDPEMTRRNVVDRIRSGEYKNISFIHRVRDCLVEDVTADILAEVEAANYVHALNESISFVDRALFGADHLRDLRKHEAV